MRRTDSFPHVADVMVNSMYDPGTGAVHAFEEQIGSHGGLGGEQSRPFLLWPRTLTDPLDALAAEDGAPVPAVVGAEAVHRVLARWIKELCGPQVPLREEGFAGGEREDAPSPPEPGAGTTGTGPSGSGSDSFSGSGPGSGPSSISGSGSGSGADSGSGVDVRGAVPGACG